MIDLPFDACGQFFCDTTLRLHNPNLDVVIRISPNDNRNVADVVVARPCLVLSHGTQPTYLDRI
jgi:hypothetical protein